jgi:hypothetical protein
MGIGSGFQYEKEKFIADNADSETLVKSESDKLVALLAANFGRQKNDESKQRRVANEYVKLRGNSRGGDRKSNPHNGGLKLTQEQIAVELGVSTTELERMLAIERKLTPELKQILDDGAFTKTTASKIQLICL